MFLACFILSSNIDIGANIEMNEKKGSIAGRVIDENMQPLQKATVTVSLANKKWFGVTDEDGEFEIENLLSDTTYEILVELDNYTTRRMKNIFLIEDKRFFDLFPLKIDTTNSVVIEQTIPDCQFKLKNGICPKCHNKLNAIPIAHGHPAINSDWFKNNKPFVDYYPGGCMVQYCQPDYYCKKDSLLF